MSSMTAFLVPASRPAVIVLLLIIVATVCLMLVTVRDDDFPTQHVDVGLLAIFGFVGGAGFMAGASLREVQHASFTWMLPGVRRKTFSGYLITALAMAGVTALFVSLQRPTPGFLVLLAIGLTTFTLASVLADRRSKLLSPLCVLLALGALFGSEPIAASAVLHPVPTALACVALAGFFAHRAFGIAAFREYPFRPLAPLPGSFAATQSVRFEREKLALRAARRGGIARRRFSHGARDWTSRAWFEVARGRPLKMILSESRVLLPVLALFVVHALALEAPIRFDRGLAHTVYHSLLKPPIGSSFDPKTPYLTMPLFLAAMVGVLAVSRGRPLGAAILYPLSREGRFRATAKASLWENVVFIVVTGGGLYLLAELAGLYGGERQPLAYVPQLLRATAAAGALIPMFQWVRLRSQEAGTRRSRHLTVSVSLLILVGVTASGLWCSFSPVLFRPAGLDLAAQLALWLTAQWLYLHALRRHFRHGDLA